MGKTGLIHHVFNQLNETGKIDAIYFDIYYTDSLPGFINKFGTSVLAVEEFFPEKIKRKINQFIKSVRPTIMYDALTGTPVFSFHLENEIAGLHTLEEIPADEYGQFIRKQFEKGSFVVFEEAIIEIMTLTLRHTYYVQFLCNRLYGMGMKDLQKGNEILCLRCVLRQVAAKALIMIYDCRFNNIRRSTV